MAFKVTTLAWGAIFYESQLQAAGEHKPGTEIAAASIVFRKTDKKYARQLLNKGGVISEQLALKGYISIWHERRKITLNMLEKCMKLAIIDDLTLTLFIL
ncbi:uncharacterized protein [Spinacia oleracea]|uniref:Uncharacterized protein isoform X2 n=1 Tax=Spinacia oleracea TaxID=3562 RepID=A0ABM3QHH8_SPIOL|nr:uncharacterized protein LOC110802525 isoform X2 [Spinacia oleracea]